MGKWEARNQSKRRGKDDWVVYDEFGWIKCSTLSEDTARQIVREHNAHEELVELAENYKEVVRETMRFFESGYIPFVESHALNQEQREKLEKIEVGVVLMPDEIYSIDAVLARAEGRE